MDKYIIPEYVFSFSREMILRDNEPVNLRDMEIYFGEVRGLFIHLLDKLTVNENFSAEDEQRVKNLLNRLLETKREMDSMREGV